MIEPEKKILYVSKPEHSFARLCNCCMSDNEVSSIVIGHGTHTTSIAVCVDCLAQLRVAIDMRIEKIKDTR